MLELHPAVFAVGNTYHIMVYVEEQSLMWVKVGDETYYDDSNGILRSNTKIHRMIVPMERLNEAKKYTICERKIIERKPYFTETQEIEEFEYKFKPVEGDNVRAYMVADAHNRVEEPIKAQQTFGDVDFLIMNGDIQDHSGSVENFKTIYEIVSGITGGNIPTVFSRGNHDLRGNDAEKFAEYTPMENGNTYYTFRFGKIWGLVLDCGEDKLDSNDEYGHTICCHEFRKRQTKYIKKVVAEKEYLAEGIEQRVVITHNPFTYQLKPPFNIEKDIFTEWSQLLKEHIKPDVMLCGHLHRLAVFRPGSEDDHLGQPCPVVVGSKVQDFYAGTGIEFNSDGITVAFTGCNGETICTEKI